MEMRRKGWDMRKWFGIFYVLLQLKISRFLKINLCLLLYTADRLLRLVTFYIKVNRN